MREWLRNGFCFGLGFVAAKLALAMLFFGLLLAFSPADAQVRIPQMAVTYRIAIEREAARNFGIHGTDYVARFAAQVHVESGWLANAQSPYAIGLTQFTPATAKWLPTVCPSVGEPDPWDPQWALRAQACYMAWLYDRVKPYQYARAMSNCSHWALAFRAYNGGEGMLNRERLATQRAGDDANDWNEIAKHRVRAKWAHKENIDYPRRIMLRWEPAYINAGWPGQAVC